MKNLKLRFKIKVLEAWQWKFEKSEILREREKVQSIKSCRGRHKRINMRLLLETHQKARTQYISHNVSDFHSDYHE